MKIDFTTNNLDSAQILSTIPKALETKDFDQEFKKALKDKDDKKLYDACVELESVFISQVLNSMLASIPRSDFINRSFATETFESMLYDEYAKEISKTQSTGIADILYNQLTRKY